jgi:predicted  nucleic acid-binding Zn-ribbon protein
MGQRQPPAGAPTAGDVAQMVEWVDKLLAVQDMDLRVDQLRQQVQAVPAQKAEAEKLLRDAQEAADQAKHALLEEEKALKTLEIEADTIREKKRDFQSKSTMIKSNEEYKAAMHQIEVCDKHIEDVEDRELELMEDIETAKEELSARQRELSAAKTRIAEMHEDLDRLAKKCKAELETLGVKRDPALEAVPADAAKRYSRLRKSMQARRLDSRVLVPVRDGVCCDRCRMNVTAQTRMNARKGMLVTCGNCGAMLYWED